MANTDVTVVTAGLFNGPSLNRKQQKAIEVISKWFLANSTGTAPTAAQINTDVASAVACIIPKSPIELSAIDAAIWWKTASPSVAADRSISTLLSDAKYLYSMDDELLEILSLYLGGKVLTTLT